MVNIDLVKQKIPQEFWQVMENYTIADTFLENIADVIVLILTSKSLDSQQEKQSWFDLFPLMNKEQIDKLRDILIREKQKLEEIEQKYEQKKEELVNKYVQKFDENSYQNTIEKLQQHEESNKEKENQEAEDLLNNL